MRQQAAYTATRQVGTVYRAKHGKPPREAAEAAFDIVCTHRSGAFPPPPSLPPPARLRAPTAQAPPSFPSVRSAPLPPHTRRSGRVAP